MLYASLVACPTHKIVIVGLGGLGIPALWALIAKWPQEVRLELSLIDPDQVELSNLNRQVLYQQSDIGRAKVEIVIERLSVWEPRIASLDIDIQTFQKKLKPENSCALLKGASVVVDACDCSRTKFLINDHCVEQKIAFCYGGVAGRGGQLMFYNPSQQNPPACLRCLFGDFQDKDFQNISQSCSQAGILGPIAGMLGMRQAEQVLQYSLGGNSSECSGSRLIKFDLENLNPRILNVSPALDCLLACAKHSSEIRQSNLSELDLRETKCPMTLVYTKVALEALDLEQQLTVCFSEESSARNVAESLSIEGQKISELSKGENGWTLRVQRIS